MPPRAQPPLETSTTQRLAIERKSSYFLVADAPRSRQRRRGSRRRGVPALNGPRFRRAVRRQSRAAQRSMARAPPCKLARGAHSQWARAAPHPARRSRNVRPRLHGAASTCRRASPPLRPARPAAGPPRARLFGGPRAWWLAARLHVRRSVTCPPVPPPPSPRSSRRALPLRWRVSSWLGSAAYTIGSYHRLKPLVFSS